MSDTPPFPFKPGDHQIGGIWVDAEGHRITYDAQGRKASPGSDARPEDWKCWRDPNHRTATDLLFGWPRCAECPAAPQYHERHPSPEVTLIVMVPVNEEQELVGVSRIAKGSAIVAVRLEHNLYKVSFEGRIYDPLSSLELDPMQRYESALVQAADRLVTDYPTIAVGHVDGSAMLPVGTYNPHEKRLEILDETTLWEWIGTDEA